MEFNRYTYAATLFDHVTKKGNGNLQEEAEKELLRRGFSQKELERIQNDFKRS